MNYGFNDNKEKVEMYATYEAFSSILSLNPGDWNIFNLFNSQLKLLTRRIGIEGIPAGGEAPPTEIPAGTTIGGRVYLPWDLTSDYESAADIFNAIVVTILPHYEETADGRLNIELASVVDMGEEDYYLTFSLTNRNNVAVPFPTIDIIMIAKENTIIPPEPPQE